MHKLARFADARNTTEGKILSVVMAFLLAFSLFNAPAYAGETADELVDASTLPTKVSSETNAGDAAFQPATPVDELLGYDPIQGPAADPELAEPGAVNASHPQSEQEVSTDPADEAAGEIKITVPLTITGPAMLWLIDENNEVVGEAFTADDTEINVSADKEAKLDIELLEEGASVTVKAYIYKDAPTPSDEASESEGPQELPEPEEVVLEQDKPGYYTLDAELVNDETLDRIVIEAEAALVEEPEGVTEPPAEEPGGEAVAPENPSGSEENNASGETNDFEPIDGSEFVGDDDWEEIVDPTPSAPEEESGSQEPTQTPTVTTPENSNNSVSDVESEESEPTVETAENSQQLNEIQFTGEEGILDNSELSELSEEMNAQEEVKLASDPVDLLGVNLLDVGMLANNYEYDFDKADTNTYIEMEVGDSFVASNNGWNVSAETDNENVASLSVTNLGWIKTIKANGPGEATITLSKGTGKNKTKYIHITVKETIKFKVHFYIAGPNQDTQLYVESESLKQNTAFSNTKLPDVEECTTKDNITYGFDGWYTDDTFETKVNLDHGKLEKDENWYGRYREANVYTYIATEGGSVSSNQEVVFIGEIPQNVTATENQSKGYSFVGWYYNNEIVSTYKTFIPTNAGIYTAKFEKECTVEFSPNNASGATPSDIKVKSGENITLPGQGDMKKYDAYGEMTFVGWSTDRDLKPSESNDGLYAEGSSIAVENNMRLYAIWASKGNAQNQKVWFYIRLANEPLQYPLEPGFNLNNDRYTSYIVEWKAIDVIKIPVLVSDVTGKEVSANLKKQPGTEDFPKAVIDELKKEFGQDFDLNNYNIIWYVCKQQSDGWHIDGVLVDKGTVLLSYKPNSPTGNTGGYAVQSQSFEPGKSVNISDCTWSVPGYTFIGWCTEPEGEGAWYSKDELYSQTEAGEYILYARWKEKNAVSIHYRVAGEGLDVNTVTKSSENLNPVIGEAQGSEPIAAIGYTFVGWYPDELCTPGTELTTAESSNKYIPQKPESGWVDGATYYAKFEKDLDQTKDITYTVKYFKNGQLVEGNEGTVVTTQKVWINDPDTITLSRDKVAPEGKYIGYKLDKTPLILLMIPTLLKMETPSMFITSLLRVPTKLSTISKLLMARAIRL